jgi:hypothetical protein
VRGTGQSAPLQHAQERFARPDQVLALGQFM